MGNIYGKDGSIYHDPNEAVRANAKWEQQQKQNELLKEQNKLIKEQNKLKEMELNNSASKNDYSSFNRDQSLNYSQEEIEKIQENFNKNFREFEIKEENGTLEPQYKKIFEEMKKSKQEVEELQKERKRLEKKIENFNNICNNKIFPLMEDAGIKDPVEYVNKLYDLYSSYPTEKFLDLLNQDNYEIISEEKLKNYPSSIAEKIRLLNNILKFNASLLIKIYLFFSIAVSVGVGISTRSIIGAVIGGVFTFAIMMLIVLTSKPSKKKIKEEKIKKIPEINLEIEKYNTTIKEKISNWENKIKKYEDRRLSNFNYSLEFALDFYSKLSLNMDDNENKKQNNFRLQFNNYPDDWEEKLADFYNSLENKIDDGTEIFDDLLSE